MALNGSSIV